MQASFFVYHLTVKYFYCIIICVYRYLHMRERTQEGEHMAKQNTLKEVQERMQELLDARAAELNEAQQKQAEAQAQKAEAEKAIKAATESMDLQAYEKASQARQKAQTAINMYAARFAQLQEKEFIPEAESDKVINSLLAYEEDLAVEFKADIKEPLAALAAIVKSYNAAVVETENTIRSWCAGIHENYDTRGASTYTDPITKERTTRSPVPVPVHRTGYPGCDEYVQLQRALEQMKITEG